MALKYTYEKEADLPEAHKAIYAEKEIELTSGDKKKLWVLDVDDVVPKARFVEFRTNNTKLFDENKQLKEKIEGIDDPDRARALLKIAKDVELDEAEKFLKKGGMDAIVEERVKVVKADMDKKLADATTKATAAQQALDKERIENALMKACGSFSLQPQAEVAILRMADGVWTRKDNQIVSLDAQGNPKPSKDGTGNLTIREWLEHDLLTNHKYLLKESTGGGTGGSGGTGGQTDNVNPWKKDTFNLTKQGAIMKADPAKAQRMMVAAGVPVPA